MAVREYRWIFNAGSGNTIHDSLADALTLSNDGGNIAWAWCDVFGTKRYVLDQPARWDGVYTGRLVTPNITYDTYYWTLMILMRWTGDMNTQDLGGGSEGCLAALEVTDFGTVLTTKDNYINLNIMGTPTELIANADIPLGDFFWLTITSNNSRIKRYINKNVYGSNLSAARILKAGAPLPFMGYSDVSYRPHAQVAEIRFKLEAEMDESTIFSYIDDSGIANTPAKFNISFPGDKLGDMIGQGTLEAGGTDVSHVLPGQTLGADSVVRFYSEHSCNAQVNSFVRRGLGKLYVQYYYFLPTGITFIADGGGTPSPSTKWFFFRILRTTVTRYLSATALNGAYIMASFNGVCDTDANTMVLEHVSYRPSSGGAETVIDLDATRPSLNAWHKVEAIIDITNGTLTVKHDGVVVANVTGLSWDQSPVAVVFEQQYSSHIDTPYVHYGKLFAVGEDDPNSKIQVMRRRRLDQ